MSDHIETIKTIEEFMAWVKELSDGSMLYRGLADKDWPVEASASRRIKGHSNENSVLMPVFQNYVSKILEDARQWGLGHRANMELCDLELLADLQHYGAATCLIDFTQTPLTALWFACWKKPKTDGRVIGMRTDNTELFKIVTSDQQKEKIGIFFEQEGLWKWSPRDINKRIVAQQSVFVFGKPQIEESHYESVIIDKSNKTTIIEALKKYYSILASNLFRDMGGFAIVNAHNRPYTEYKAEDYFSLGVDAHQKQEFERAIKYYSTVIELNPDDANAYNNRGAARSNLGDYKGAIEDYDKATELNPDYVGAYNNRGAARSKLGNYKGAIEDYNKAIELNPNHANAYYKRGVAKGNLSNYKGTIEDYDKAIALNPDFSLAYNNRGLAKDNLSDYKDAIEDYDKAIELNPNYAITYYNRGVIKNKLSNYKGAIEDYDKAIELNPDFSLAYNNRGFAKDNLSDYKGAIEDYDKAIELNPNFAEAYNNRGVAKGKLGDYIKAQ